ncbi:MAG: ribonuclease PH [Thermaerobacter sp.]|nr:ribonuclease PH [Thermaerobacter sp.]
MVRDYNRGSTAIRPVELQMGYNAWAEGSCLISMGMTRVLVTATVEDKVPPFLRNSGRGWVSAEYGMLPRATHERTHREATRGRQQGRTVEIQRLIGRALRASLDLKVLGERSILLDCDVLQADGGTRTAAITAGFLALLQAVSRIHAKTPFADKPFRGWLAALSIGLEQGEPLLDLNYEEDSRIGVDLNLVMLSGGKLVEIQGTAEHSLFDRQLLERLLDAAEPGFATLFQRQQEAFPEGQAVIA